MTALWREIGKKISPRGDEQHQNRSCNHEVEWQDQLVRLPSQHIRQAQHASLDHVNDGHGLIMREPKAKQFMMNVCSVADEWRTAFGQPLSGHAERVQKR